MVQRKLYELCQMVILWITMTEPSYLKSPQFLNVGFSVIYLEWIKL